MYVERRSPDDSESAYCLQSFPQCTYLYIYLLKFQLVSLLVFDHSSEDTQIVFKFRVAFGFDSDDADAHDSSLAARGETFDRLLRLRHR